MKPGEASLVSGLAHLLLAGLLSTACAGPASANGQPAAATGPRVDPAAQLVRPATAAAGLLSAFSEAGW